jgi:hypothetical protein
MELGGLSYPSSSKSVMVQSSITDHKLVVGQEYTEICDTEYIYWLKGIHACSESSRIH